MALWKLWKGVCQILSSISNELRTNKLLANFISAAKINLLFSQIKKIYQFGGVYWKLRNLVIPIHY